MKVVVDVDQKCIELIGLWSIEEVSKFMIQHRLEDYKIRSYTLNLPAPQFPMPSPPFIPTCWETTSTGGPITTIKTERE